MYSFKLIYNQIYTTLHCWALSPSSEISCFHIIDFTYKPPKSVLNFKQRRREDFSYYPSKTGIAKHLVKMNKKETILPRLYDICTYTALAIRETYTNRK